MEYAEKFRSDLLVDMKTKRHSIYTSPFYHYGIEQLKSEDNQEKYNDFIAKGKSKRYQANGFGKFNEVLLKGMQNSSKNISKVEK